SCFSPQFREELYADVERLQGEVGDLNDLRQLYGALADLRRSLTGNCSPQARDETKSLFERFTPSPAHERLNGKSAVPHAWKKEGSDLIGRVERLLQREAPLRAADATRVCAGVPDAALPSLG